MSASSALAFHVADSPAVAPNPLVPSAPPNPRNEVKTTVQIYTSPGEGNAFDITFGTTLPAGAVFVGTPTFGGAGGAPVNLGACTSTTTSYKCTGGFASGGGNVLDVTFTVSLTPAYTSTTFTQPFDNVTYADTSGGATKTLAFPTIAPVVVTPDTTPPSCTVTAMVLGPPKQEGVTVQDTLSGLASISNIQITNGTVQIAPFTPFSNSPVVATATKNDPSLGTVWFFDATDTAGNVMHCA